MLRPLFLHHLLFFLGCLGDDQVQRTKRGATEFNTKLWESPIRYSLDNTYTEEQKTIIRAGVQTFINNTCIDFKEELPGLKLLAYVNVGGCSSDLGDRRYGKNHLVHLTGGCISIHGTQHETMHALGFDHTNNRPDRDAYIKVNFENINVSERERFYKQNTTKAWTDYGIPYEYNSILHEIPISGAINKDVPSITTIDPDYYYTMEGKGHGMVFNDWKLINLHYKCPDKCNTTINCKNGGYQHHKCKECVCTRFYKGTNCEVENDPVILKTGETTHLDWAWSGPAYEKRVSSEAYPTFDRTARLIKAPEGMRINITIVDVTDNDIRSFKCFYGCTFRALEIVDGDLTRVGKRFCCGDRLPYTFISETNIIGYHVYARPGLDFVANATFAVVDAPQELPTTVTQELQTTVSQESQTTTTVPQEPHTTVPEEPQTTGPQEPQTRTTIPQLSQTTIPQGPQTTMPEQPQPAESTTPAQQPETATTSPILVDITTIQPQEPQTQQPVTEAKNETIFLKMGEPKQIDDGWTLDVPRMMKEVKKNPIEYWRKADRIITAPEGTRIQIKINDLNDWVTRESGCIPSCKFMGITFVDGNEEKSFCCNVEKGHSFMSSSNVVTFQMKVIPGLDFAASVSFTVMPISA